MDPPPLPSKTKQTTIRIVGIRLLYSFTIISLMPTNFVGYLEARYGLKSHEVRTHALAFLHSFLLSYTTLRRPGVEWSGVEQ